MKEDRKFGMVAGDGWVRERERRYDRVDWTQLGIYDDIGYHCGFHIHTARSRADLHGHCTGKCSIVPTLTKCQRDPAA